MCRFQAPVLLIRGNILRDDFNCANSWAKQVVVVICLKLLKLIAVV